MIFCPKFQRIICFSVIFLILIFFSVGNIFGQQAQASSYSKSILAGGLGALDNPTGKPLGGGEGYGDWVPKPPSLVTSRNELIEALNSATPGTVVYVDDSAEINLTGEWNLPINKDVTLASGRGHDGSRGALLFTQDQMAAKRPLLAVLGSGARITGLRLRGPNTNLDPPDSNNDARAIRISADNVEVDNNEIWKWARSGILAQGRQGIHIHHNYIHHQSRASLNPDCVHCGLAYGVSLSNSFALIEANIFSHNRHDIADAGLELSGYEARYNLALDVRGTGAHNFDMHGSCPYSVDSSQVECDSGGCCDDNCLYPTICTIRGKKKGGTIAGNKILIHQNTFLQNVINAVRIRGKPLDGARIYYNHFLGSQDVDDDNPNRPTADNRRDAVAQSSVPADVEMTEVAHMFVFDNMYNFDPDPAWYVWFGGYSGLILDSSQGILKFRRFEPVPLSEVRFGDFDGDGRTDIFSVTPEGEFLRWRYSPGGIGKWVNLTRSSVPLENLRFGDFDGDGKTDVFSVKKEGNSFRWRYSKAGLSRWMDLAKAPPDLKDLRFGYFDEDDRTDVFSVKKEGNFLRWRYSPGGMQDFENLTRSSVPLENLRFGDFDGDGKTDVFSVKKEGNSFRWRYSKAGLSRWMDLAKAPPDLKDLRFGDFDGDGKTDVFNIRKRNDFFQWRYSRGGVQRFQSLTRANAPLEDLRFGDFDGDGSTDVIVRRSTWTNMFDS